jgi:hypothetical protein
LDTIPNAEKAVIDNDKLNGYILSFSHPLGRFKAAFFQKLGFSVENCELFEQCLREIILTREVTKIETSRHGRKYVVEGSIVSPSGQKVHLVTVWIILNKEVIPRFITAYPRGGLQ